MLHAKNIIKIGQCFTELFKKLKWYVLWTTVYINQKRFHVIIERY